MFRGLYSGASALDYLERQHQITSSNLAHLNTPGHRRAVFSVQERTESIDTNEPRPGATLSNNVDFATSGRHEKTNRQLDLAINGDGFFQFQGSAGTVYSRNGVMFRTPEGQLVNRDGLPLLGEGGPIVISPEISERDVSIGRDGSITANGNQVGKIAMVQFDDNRLLESENQIDFRAGRAIATPAVGATIEQGSRELSNAQPVTELINLIISSRHFEAAQRAIRSLSEAIQQGIQD